ncbi:hypothetical protein AZE42_08281 [Rhizopogon vesiculosus]|uniref:Uncharacterized protein n=1 Tax=Rhizopogon vesiculosus TaxID=180088 RepID=A0A1J8PLR3_9AGAM|nr:hypothetical protein AZE42_08281 [Rhizopogon vesiculosus]
MQIGEDGVFSLEDHTKDTLKVSGMQVPPVDIGTILFAHPDKLITDKLITDIAIAGLRRGNFGRAHSACMDCVVACRCIAGGEEVVIRLDEWVHKRLRGGIVIVRAVGVFLCF